MIHAIKPGHMPEPLKPVNTHDPQSAIDRCLHCTSKNCHGNCNPRDNAMSSKVEAREDDQETRRRLDEKIGTMLAAGYSDYPICRALNITEKELKRAKRRLKYLERKQQQERGSVT